jgi:hypothetical protein
MKEKHKNSYEKRKKRKKNFGMKKKKRKNHSFLFKLKGKLNMEGDSDLACTPRS